MVVPRMKATSIGKGLIEEPFAVMDGDQLDEILVGGAVELASLVARIDEGVQPDVGDQAGAAGGDLAEELGHHSLREVVRLEAALQRHAAHCRCHRPVAGDNAADQAIEGEHAEPALGLVADAGAVDEGQVARMPGSR